MHHVWNWSASAIIFVGVGPHAICIKFFRRQAVPPFWFSRAKYQEQPPRTSHKEARARQKSQVSSRAFRICAHKIIRNSVLLYFFTSGSAVIFHIQAPWRHYFQSAYHTPRAFSSVCPDSAVSDYTSVMMYFLTHLFTNLLRSGAR